jgi:hypothetical protein
MLLTIRCDRSFKCFLDAIVTWSLRLFITRYSISFLAWILTCLSWSRWLISELLQPCAWLALWCWWWSASFKVRPPTCIMVQDDSNSTMAANLHDMCAGQKNGVRKVLFLCAKGPSFLIVTCTHSWSTSLGHRLKIDLLRGSMHILTVHIFITQPSYNHIVIVSDSFIVRIVFVKVYICDSFFVSVEG